MTLGLIACAGAQSFAVQTQGPGLGCGTASGGIKLSTWARPRTDLQSVRRHRNGVTMVVERRRVTLDLLSRPGSSRNISTSQSDRRRFVFDSVRTDSFGESWASLGMQGVDFRITFGCTDRADTSSLVTPSFGALRSHIQDQPSGSP